MRNYTMIAAAAFGMAGVAKAPAQYGEEPRLSQFPTVEKMLREILSESEPKSFVYVTEFEVRHEMLFPINVLQEWVPLARADSAFVTREERLAATRTIASTMSQRNPVRIDGVAVRPTTFSMVFFDVENLDKDTPEIVLAQNAVVGVIFGYQPKGMPTTVDMTWEFFSEDIDVIDLTIYAFKDAALTSKLTPEAPTATWQNPGREPLPPIEKLAAPTPRRGWFSSEWKADAKDSGAVLSVLLRNIYRAFDYRAESDVYDALANSIDGPLLPEVYLQIQRGLVYQSEGGAMSRVDEVAMVEGTLRDSGTSSGNVPWFEYETQWTVAGTVEHWGHRHARQNRYDARFRVESREGNWRITSFQVLGQERLSEKFSQRESQ